MKRIFTLMTGLLLLGGSLSAQAKYTSVINNGNLEGEELESFWVQEWRSATDESRTDGLPNVIEDPAKAGNHVIAVRARSAEEGGGTIERYDTQFFITAGKPDALGTVDEEGNFVAKQIHIVAKIRADKAAHIGTQAHAAPGSYVGYNTFGE